MRVRCATHCATPPLKGKGWVTMLSYTCITWGCQVEKRLWKKQQEEPSLLHNCWTIFNYFEWVFVFLCFFSVWLLWVLHGHSFFSSPHFTTANDLWLQRIFYPRFYFTLNGESATVNDFIEAANRIFSHSHFKLLHDGVELYKYSSCLLIEIY